MIGVSSLAEGAGRGFAQHALGIGISVGFEKVTGSSTKDAIVHGTVQYAADMYFKGAMLIPQIVDVTKAGYSMYRDYQLFGQSRIQQYYRGGFGGNYHDTQQGYTMRQRGIQALQQSKMNARSTLGSEARMMCRI